MWMVLLPLDSRLLLLRIRQKETPQNKRNEYSAGKKVDFLDYP